MANNKIRENTNSEKNDDPSLQWKDFYSSISGLWGALPLIRSLNLFLIFFKSIFHESRHTLAKASDLIDLREGPYRPSYFHNSHIYHRLIM